jgi:hypothetical protein
MPYIVQYKRHHLDPHIDNLLNALRELESDDPANTHCGNLNYVFTRILNASYTQRYAEINEAVGVLECCKLELYRKLAAPYEDLKEFENGVVTGDSSLVTELAPTLSIRPVNQS